LDGKIVEDPVNYNRLCQLRNVVSVVPIHPDQHFPLFEIGAGLMTEWLLITTCWNPC